MVHKTVGVGVIGLSSVSQHGGDRGKDRKEVQFLSAGKFVQIYGPSYLGRQYHSDFIPALFAYQRIPVKPRAVNHPVNPAESLLRPAEQADYFLPVTDIGPDVNDFTAVALHRGKQLFLGGGQGGPSGQDETGPVFAAEILGKFKPQCARSPGNQIDPFFLKR